MHPHIVRRLLRRMAPPGSRVLDPFCGSGTTLVEAVLRQCQGFGVDAHPLAVRLTRLKCSLWPEAELEQLSELGQQIGETAWRKARMRERSASRAEPDPRELEWFEPHVRFEIANLKEGIAAVEWSRGKDALEMVLSSILVKVSNLASDSNATLLTRQIPRGFTSQRFADRTQELCSALYELRKAAPEGAKSPKVREGDARWIRGVQEASIDVIVTSPPYVGVYDYPAHQELRCAILGIDDSESGRAEIGARRRMMVEPTRAADHWLADMTAALTQARKLLTPGGSAFVMVGNSRVAGQVVDSATLLEEAALAAGLDHVATASQGRPEFTPRSERHGRGRLSLDEHLVWVRKPKSES
jgi:hypothetical protein